MGNIILKLKRANLTGRGGAGFPTGLKWELVKQAKGDEKYIVCNASEGEPGVFKDKYILENYARDVVNGIVLAMEAIKAKTAYIYLNKEYYDKYKLKLKKQIGKKNIILFKKIGGYIAGEESAALESIEGKRPEPRQKPPFISEKGLFGMPTLVNNVETFYYASKIAKDEYKNTRFYSVNGDVKNKGVFEFTDSMSIKKVLEKTKNYPGFEFFVQVGGGASGEILLIDELDKPATGAGSITVYNLAKTDLIELMDSWLKFFMCGNCDKCSPCREGIYRLREMIKAGDIGSETMQNILFSLRESSFCALGRGVPVPIESLINKVYVKKKKN